MILVNAPARAGLLTLAFSPAAQAHAQAASAVEAPTATPAAGTDVTGDEIVVTGSYARSLEAAAKTKREAGYGLDAINAQDIGKFPTQNVAEALQLVTGVTITRPRGEGLYVSVRGLGPQFQTTVLNGRPIAINELIENGGAAGRQFRFEVLPSEFVSQIEVVKTPTADMDEGALGGNINIKTFRPLDVGRKITANARVNYTDLTKKATPSLSGLASWTNADDTFGVLVSGLYVEKRVRNDRLLNFGWNLNQFTSVVGPGLYTPTRTRPTIETEDRKRASGALSLQWRPNPELETTVDVLVTRLDVDYDEFGIDIYPDDRSVAGHIPVFVAGTQKIDGNTVVGGTINDVRFMASREHSLNRHDLVTAGLNQKWTPGRWTLSADVNWSYAHSYHPSFADATLRSRAAFFGPLTYDTSGGYKQLPTLTTTLSLTDPANYTGFPFDDTRKNSRDTDFVTRGDIAREFDGVLSKLAAGAEYHSRYRNYIRRDFVLTGVVGVPLTTLGQSFYETLPYDDFLSGFDANSPRDWLAPVTAAFFDKLYSDALLDRPLTASDLRSSFKLKEKIYAGYARADYGFDAGPVPISGNIGIRYVRTHQIASGTLTVGPTPQPVAFPKTFNDWLPSFNLRAAFSPNLIGRLAASRVLTRPNITDTAPRITVANDSPTGSGGNPDLVPFLADQYDASLEWYFSRQGSLTGALFYKKLDNYITSQNANVEIPGRGTILLSTQVNGGKAKVYGFEAAYNQVFTFLPRPFDGLGIQASYTRTEVEAEYNAGARLIKDQLIGLSKQSYNLVGFYEKGPLSARLGYTWRDKYLSGTGSTTQASQTTAAFGSLDGAINIAVTSNIAVSLEAINLSNASRYVYSEAKNRPTEINNYGRTLMAGVRASF